MWCECNLQKSDALQSENSLVRLTYGMQLMNSLESSFLVAVVVSKLRGKKLAVSFSSWLAVLEAGGLPCRKNASFLYSYYFQCYISFF